MGSQIAQPFPPLSELYWYALRGSAVELQSKYHWISANIPINMVIWIYVVWQLMVILILAYLMTCQRAFRHIIITSHHRTIYMDHVMTGDAGLPVLVCFLITVQCSYTSLSAVIATNCSITNRRYKPCINRIPLTRLSQVIHLNPQL